MVLPGPNIAQPGLNLAPTSLPHRSTWPSHGQLDNIAQHDPNIAQTGDLLLLSLRNYHLTCYYSDFAGIGEFVC